MAVVSIVYKYCYDGNLEAQGVSNGWESLLPYLKIIYPSSTSLVRQIVLKVNANMDSFKVNYPYAFDLSKTEQERVSFGFSLAIMVKRLLDNIDALYTAVPSSSSSADAEEYANIRYSLDNLKNILLNLVSILPVPCP